MIASLALFNYFIISSLTGEFMLTFSTKKIM